MSCDQCGKEIKKFVEKIEFSIGNDLIRINNNPKTPICQDCMEKGYKEVLEGFKKNPW